MGVCGLCSAEFPDGGDSKTIHESGRRHQRAVERQAQAAELAKKSVFVALSRKKDVGNKALDGDAIVAAFSAFGDVAHVSCGFLEDHAFVEFNSQEAAERAIAAKSVRISDTLSGVIYERRVTFHDEHDNPSIEIDEVIQHVNDACCRGFSCQIDRIYSCIGITDQETKLRNAFRKKFEELLRRYVHEPCVIQFGSAITGIGTNDSDIDLCLLFKDGSPSLMSDFIRDGNALLTCESFRESPLHRDELSTLLVRDQTEVLFRLLKEIRREKSGFFKSLYIVSDARCPVIRFRSYDRHLVELSVNNKIGYQKSVYIGALVKADLSGLLRKLALALRFWAMSNGVFSSEKKKTWNLNSYTLMMMFFAYLQSEQFLPAFKHSEQEEMISGTRVDFDVPSYTLSNIDTRKLFKKFFVLCVEKSLEKVLFSLRHGGLVPLEDFKNELVLKQHSILFVQDPIEISDNVAKNVTSKALKTMRHAMMLSLAAMKQNADSFAVMLRVLRTETASTSPSPNLPVTEGSCKISGLPEGIDEELAESLLSIILFAVLHCETPATPAKRARFECETADLGLFATRKRLWMSRRTLRKKWSGLLGSEEQFPLLVEALVSASLDSVIADDCSLQFLVFFDVHRDTLWVGLKLMEGESVDVANVAHFIEQMLTKARDYLSTHGIDGCALSLDVFAQRVRIIFEREKEGLK